MMSRCHAVAGPRVTGGLGLMLGPYAEDIQHNTEKIYRRICHRRFCIENKRYPISGGAHV